MGSITTSFAKGYRLQEWATLINECMNRPKGMKVTEWCAERNISKDTYYYWFTKVRQACLDVTLSDSVPDGNSSAIVPVSRELLDTQQINADSHVDISVGNYVIHVNESTTKELLEMVLKVSANV